MIFDKIISQINKISLIRGEVFVAALWWIWFSTKTPQSLGAEDNRMFVGRSIVGSLVAIALARCLQLAMPKRLRPMHDSHLGFQLPYEVDPDSLKDWSSFPSDHAVVFFAIPTAIFLWSRAWGTIAFLWSLVIVCMPRIYMGFHYPSDVVIGAVLGVSTMVTVHRIAVPSRAFDVIKRYEAAYPAAFYTFAFIFTYQIATLFSDVRQLVSGALIVLGTIK
jgi:undecaprenyl-diphosphatase